MPGVANLKQLLPMLSTRVPNCETGLQVRALRESAVMFCDQSKAWQQNMTPISTVVDQLAYSITNQWQADIALIKRVGFRTAEQITENPDDEGREISASSYRYSPETVEIIFDTAPSSTAITDALLVRAVLVPQFESNEIADWFLNMYRNGIIAGAVNILCTSPIPGVYNPVVARRNEIVFNNEVTKAQFNARQNWSAAPVTIGKGYDLI